MHIGDQILDLPSQDYLNEELSYIPDTGLLWWKMRKRGRRFHKPAGNRTPAGYVAICLDWQSYQAHRIIWKMLTGEDPDQIDHINGVKHDNRWVNLRDISRSINMLNVPNRLGVQQERNGRWGAKICIQGNHIRIGTFDTSEEAFFAYQEYRETHIRELT